MGGNRLNNLNKETEHMEHIEHIEQDDECKGNQLAQIQTILEEKQIRTYSIVEENRQSAELFFVKKNLDLNRSKDVTEWKVTIYRDVEKDGKKQRGSSKVIIYPEQTNKQMAEMIEEGWQSAGYALNPYYPLPESETMEIGTIPSSLAKYELMDSAFAMAKAFYAADQEKDAFINSMEIFSEKKNLHIVTSEGCDVRYTKYNINGEFVVQSLANNNDVEQYQHFHYDDLDTEAAASRCKDALCMVKDRAFAKKAPDDLSDYPIILYGSTVGEFLGFYKERANASMIYPKYSPYQIGFDAQKDAAGERLNLNVIPTVPYNEEGTKLDKHILLENGVLKNIHGNAAYSSYIGVKPIGSYQKIECLNGTVEYQQMLQKPYLLIKNFSDFQIDELDGHFGGEFRLAYLFDGKETTILTGGTISGNILEAQKAFKFSKERYKDADYEGPLAVRIN